MSFGIGNVPDDAGLQPILLALPSFSPSLAVEVLPYGLTIHRILVNAGGKTHDLLIGPDDPQEHKAQRRFLNTIVGRYSNRIPAGESVISKNGIQAQMTIAATESPEVNLHGGDDGFDRRVFSVTHPGDASGYSLFSDSEKEILQSQTPASAIFKLSSPDGDQGFPGRLDVEVALGLLQPGAAPPPKDGEYDLGSIFIIYRAKLITEEGQKAITPVNLTQHWGFNLDASLAQPGGPTPDVLGEELSIYASHTIALRPNLLATGELDPVEGTPHHHENKPIGEAFPDKGYDSFYVFTKSSPGSALAPSRLPLSAFPTFDGISSVFKTSATEASVPVELSSNQSGLRINFESNQPGVQFYSGNYLQKVGTRKKIHGGTDVTGSGDGYQDGAAAFLEFHEPHAAWLHPWGQGENADGDTLLTSDEFYHNTVKLNVYYRPVADPSE